jgi:hypothetical protein
MIKQRTQTRTFSNISTESSTYLTFYTGLEIAIKKGLEAGLLMSFYQWLLVLIGIDHLLVLQAVGYSYLALVLLRGLRHVKWYSTRYTYFKNSLLLGVGISFITALVSILQYLFTYEYGPTLEVEAWNVQMHWQQVGPEFLTILLSGTILSLLIWYFLKYPTADRSGLKK